MRVKRVSEIIVLIIFMYFFAVSASPAFSAEHKQGAGLWFRKGAGALIAVLGIYFIGNPFWGN
jgi:hypothetical protein